MAVFPAEPALTGDTSATMTPTRSCRREDHKPTRRCATLSLRSALGKQIMMGLFGVLKGTRVRHLYERLLLQLILQKHQSSTYLDGMSAHGSCRLLRSVRYWRFPSTRLPHWIISSRWPTSTSTKSTRAMASSTAMPFSNG